MLYTDVRTQSGGMDGVVLCCVVRRQYAMKANMARTRKLMTTIHEHSIIQRQHSEAGRTVRRTIGHGK